jgi:class 3 adenylate cyclase
MSAKKVSSNTPPKDEFEAFLKTYPWPQDWTSRGKSLEWFWAFELRTPPAKLWDRLADTSTFNMRLGLPAMAFEERNGRLHGRSKNLGMVQEWEEVPWEWTWGQGLSNARLYSKGLAKLVRSRYELEAAASGGTRLKVYFGWIPSSLLGRILLKSSAGWMRDSYARALSEMDDELSGRRVTAAPEARLSKEQVQRIKTAVDALQGSGVELALSKRLESLLIKGSDEELARLRPKTLATRWHLKLAPLINLLLQATRQGLLRLTWDVVCPHCRGVRSEATSLGSLPQRGSCRSCGIDFDATDHCNLDVTFHVHPSLRQVTPRLYCAAEPGRKAHRLLQASLAPGERRKVRLRLPLGRYRARSKSLPKPEAFEIAAGAPGSGTWVLPDGAPPQSLAKDSLLELVNEGSAPQTFMLEQWTQDSEALRPGELFNFQDFRDMFSEEGVATGVKLDVGHQCLLFTDLVGSTKFYLAEGDSIAFAHVREHFMRIYEAVKLEDGAVVKTIGDACMVAFNEPHKAFRAALEIQRRFPEGGLRVRMTLHHGPCLAVNLNSHIDYFGSTVNYAAKIQSAAGAGEVVFSDEIAAQSGVKEALRRGGWNAEEFSFKHSWDQGESLCHRLKVS